MARNAGETSTVAVRSVLIHDQRATARKALTHAVTTAIPSVTHITCVADPPDPRTAFAGTPADLVLIGLHDATAGTVHAAEVFLRRYPSAPGIVFGAVDDTPALAAAVARGAQGLMLLSPWCGRHPGSGFSIGARLGVRSAPELTRIQRTVLRGMSQGRSNRDIADTLGVTEETVKAHAAQLYRKLGARDRVLDIAHRHPGLPGWRSAVPRARVPGPASLTGRSRSSRTHRVGTWARVCVGGNPRRPASEPGGHPHRRPGQ